MDLDRELERELKVRKRIKSIYTKERDDFSNKDAYDDYLEEVEDIIWRLASAVDVERTEAAVRRYRAANQEQINARAAVAANLNAHLDGAGAAASGAAAAAPPAAPLVAGGLPSLLPRLAGDPGALVDPATRNMRYDGRALARAGPEAAAAAGWSAALVHSRLAQEAFSSLVLPPPQQLQLVA